jgi:tetratricopeptide (TPR) repeat protein
MDYAHAASLFDETLVLAPDSPALRLEYARTELLAGNLPHAEKLAREFVKDYSDSQSLAQAHQILGRTLLKMNRNQDARKELETAVALDPSFENGYDLAVVCLDLDDEKCAAQLFGEMQASFGDNPEIHMNFGRAYGNSDFAPRAVAEFRKVIAENPRFPGAHYSLAAALLASGDDEANMLAAETELKKELAISPHDFLAYAALGKIAATYHRYPEAESYLKRATLLNPKNPDAFLYLGQMYFDTNRSSDAEVSLRHAIQLTDDVSHNRYQIEKAHFLLGRILMQQHRQDEARAEMQIARAFANKRLSKDKSELAGLLPGLSATAESQGASTGNVPATQSIPHSSDPGAIASLNTFKKQLSPAIADSYNNLGAITATGNDYANALRYFERAAAWNPSLDGLDYNLGHAAFMASRFADAVLPLSRYVHSHPQDSGIRSALAISQFMTRDYSGCISTLSSVDESIASIPQVQYIYAESLVKTGQLSSGKERLESLEAAHPEIAEVHRSLGEVFELRGDRQKAVEELRSAILLNPNDPETHCDLGKIDLENGDAGTAIQELESAIRLHPNEPSYHKELAGAYKLALRPVDAEKESRIYDTLFTPQARPANANIGSTKVSASDK